MIISIPVFCEVCPHCHHCVGHMAIISGNGAVELKIDKRVAWVVREPENVNDVVTVIYT